MKRLKLIFMGLYAAALSALGQSPASQVLHLDKGWSFSEGGKDKWQEATVPGTVHQDLLRLKLLPDPFFGTNEQQVQWVEDKDWEYRTSFTLTQEQVDHSGALLEFKGLVPMQMCI
jgi:beta-mannosidase